MNLPPSSKRVLSIAAACLFFVSAALPSPAQNAALGNISGIVRDASGAVIPDATVVVTNTGTSASRTLTTDSDGHYTATFLQPGMYEVVLGGGSFGKVDQKNVSVTVGSNVTIDATLTAGSVSTEVQVTSDAPLIEVDRTEVSQTVGQALVSNLPVNGRRYDNFVLLTNNVVPDGSSGLISYRGISGLYNTNLVDGANNQQAFFSEARGRGIGAPYVFSQDSIKEFQSATSGYSAEFGQAAGGQINAISKSGTNATHGDLFYYLRYPALNALDPYSKFQGRTGGSSFLLQPTVHQQQQFGGSVGGPILKDKLFYFFTYDGFRKVNPILYTSSVSSATILSYATTTPSATCPTGVSYQQCLVAAQFINSSLTAYSRNIKQDIFFPRLDYQLNATNHLSAEFNWENFHQPNGYNTSNVANNSSITQNGTANFHERIFIANWESALSGRTANAVRFQWSRDLETAAANGPGPAVTLSNLFAYGESLALPRGAFPDEHRWQIADIYSTTRGKHTLKAGVDVNLIHDYLANLFQGNGNYSYSASTAAANFGNWVQDVYGLNGARHYSSFTQVNDPITHVGADDFWNKNLAAFAEDSWKLTSNFLLDFGLRYDLQLVPQPSRPYTNSYNGIASPLGNFFTNTININYKQFQPRVGFSFNPYQGTVLRGGYGIFYGLTSNSTYYTIRAENGVFQQQYNINSPTASNAISAPGVLFTPPGPALAAPFAGAVTPAVAGGGSLTTPLSFRGLNPNFSNPYTHSFDLGIEQQLPLHSTLSIGYVGTRGMRLPYFIDVNQPLPTTTRTYDIVNLAGQTSGTVTVPFTPATVARPSPNDGSILAGYSGLNSWYHSLAVSLKKPMSHGVELLVNYTWAKALDASQVAGGPSVQNTGGGTFNGTNVILNPFNPTNRSPVYGLTSEYGRSDLDIRSRFVGSLVWTPTIASVPSYARYAVNGWTVSGTYTAQSGTPLTALMANTPGAITTPGIPAVAAGLDGGATGQAVNLNNGPSSSFGRAPFLPRNNAVYPGVHNMDARVSRDFTIHENIRFQVLAELFNVANHRQVLGVNGTAFSFVAPSSTATNCPVSGHRNTCIAPYTSTPFGTPTTTSGTLYGARQAQFAAKLFF